MRGVWTALVIGLAVAWMAAGAGAQRRGGDPNLAKVRNPVAASPVSIAAGQKLYATHCRHCHGVRGLGDGPLASRTQRPANLTDGQWDHGSSDGEIFAVIKNGLGADSEMKAVPLDDTSIWHVINFIRSIGPKPGA